MRTFPTRKSVVAVATVALLFSIAPALAAGNGQSQKPSWATSVEKNCAPATPNQDETTCHSWRVHTFINGQEIDDAREFADKVKALAGSTATPAVPAGFTPSDLKSAYTVPAPTGTPTIAIVDAFNSYATGSMLSDLNTYRTQYALGAATISIYNQAGTIWTKSNTSAFNSYRSNRGWDGEIALDIDMVSAMCPQCKIALVLAKSASFSDLNTAVASATRLTPIAISNSYGGGDIAPGSYGAYSTAAGTGIIVTASTGDSGYGVSAPASFTNVIAVGGTSLSRTSGGWSESAWSGAGSGCSTQTANQKGSQSISTGCSNKANADISAVANPNTGVSVYFGGWKVYGGTSASAPIIAAILGSYKSNGTITGTAQAYVWGRSWSDVSSGSNGTCSATQLCTAIAGWDGPTGLGTPR